MIRFVVFHLRSLVAGALAGLLFESIVQKPVWWYALLTIVIFAAGIVFLTQRYINIRVAVWDMVLILLAYVATVFLMTLTEWRTVIIMLEVLGGLTIATLVDMLLTNTETTPVYMKKAFRRIRVMSWVFISASFFVTSYAMSFFFPNIPLAILFLVVGGMASLCSYAIWRMYYQVPFQRFAIWLIIIAVMTMELFWVIHLLPFGYVVLGFLAAWVWYMLLLLIRFHISSEGIRWKHQIRFLLMNAVVWVALLLFVIRWI